MSAARPAAGLFADPRPIETLADLFANVWQVGYVTTDLDRAMEELKRDWGLEHCVEVPVGATFLGPDEQQLPWETRIAMGARGGLIVELIEPVSGEVDYYTRSLPADGSYAIRFHHFATFIPVGDEAWADVRELLARSGLRIDYQVLIPDRVRAGYVDCSAQLGHWLEICQLQPDDIALFSGLVADSA
jgi:hypothetical protein